MQEETKELYRNDEIDLLNIVRYMKKKRSIYLNLILLLAVIGFAIGMIMSEHSIEKSPAVAVLNMKQGRELKLGDFTSSYVLTKAIDASNLNGKISVDNLRNNVTIARVADEDSRRILEMYSELKIDESVIKSLSEIKVKYIDSYIVTLQNGFGNADSKLFFLNDSELSSLLQSIMYCYSDYCCEVFSTVKLPVNHSEGVDYSSLEYARSIELLKSAMSNLSSYCDSMAEVFIYNNNNNNNNSNNNRLGFADFSKLIDAAYEIQFRNFESKIYYENYVKNADNVCALYDYYIKETNLRLDEVISNIAAYDDLIANFVNENMLVLSSSNEQTISSYEANMDYYNTLVRKQTENYALKAECEKEIEDYTDRLNRIKNGGGNSGKDIDAVIKSMVGVYDELYNEVYWLANDAISSSGYKSDYVTYTSSFVTSKSIFSLNTIKKVALGICGGTFIGFCFWCLYGLVEELRGNKKAEVER